MQKTIYREKASVGENKKRKKCNNIERGHMPETKNRSHPGNPLREGETEAFVWSNREVLYQYNLIWSCPSADRMRCFVRENFNEIFYTYTISPQ